MRRQTSERDEMLTDPGPADRLATFVSKEESEHRRDRWGNQCRITGAILPQLLRHPLAQARPPGPNHEARRAALLQEGPHGGVTHPPRGRRTAGPRKPGTTQRTRSSLSASSPRLSTTRLPPSPRDYSESKGGQLDMIGLMQQLSAIPSPQQAEAKCAPCRPGQELPGTAQ